MNAYRRAGALLSLRPGLRVDNFRPSFGSSAPTRGSDLAANASGRRKAETHEPELIEAGEPALVNSAE